MCIDTKSVVQSSDRVVVMVTVDNYNRATVESASFRLRGDIIATVEFNDNWAITETLTKMEQAIRLFGIEQKEDDDYFPFWRKRVNLRSSCIELMFTLVYVRNARRAPVSLTIGDINEAITSELSPR